MYTGVQVHVPRVNQERTHILGHLLATIAIVRLLTIRILCRIVSVVSKQKHTGFIIYLFFFLLTWYRWLQPVGCLVENYSLPEDDQIACGMIIFVHVFALSNNHHRLESKVCPDGTYHVDEETCAICPDGTYHLPLQGEKK